jgi:hypothetical protein
MADLKRIKLKIMTCWSQRKDAEGAYIRNLEDINQQRSTLGPNPFEQKDQFNREEAARVWI